MSDSVPIWRDLARFSGHDQLIWQKQSEISPWDSHLEPKAQEWLGFAVRKEGVVDIIAMKGGSAIVTMGDPAAGSWIAADVIRGIGAMTNPMWNEPVGVGKIFAGLGASKERKEAHAISAAQSHATLSVVDANASMDMQPGTVDALRSALSLVPGRESVMNKMETMGIDPVRSPGALGFHAWLSGASMVDERGRLATDPDLALQRRALLDICPQVMPFLMEEFQSRPAHMGPNSYEEVLHSAVSSRIPDIKDGGDALMMQNFVHSTFVHPELSARDKSVLLGNLDVVYARAGSSLAIGLGQENQGGVGASKVHPALASTLTFAQEAETFLQEPRFVKSVAAMPDSVLLRTGQTIREGLESGMVPSPVELATRVAHAVSFPAVGGSVDSIKVGRSVIKEMGSLENGFVQEAGRAIVDGYRLDSLPRRVASIAGSLSEQTLKVSDVWDRPHERAMAPSKVVLPPAVRRFQERDTGVEQR